LGMYCANAVVAIKIVVIVENSFDVIIQR
jgi:hypothetical protein